MIVGASPERDGKILRLSEGLYRNAGLKRVYYSSYVPLVHDGILPDEPAATGACREHRLYQADWLLRFYGFSVEELVEEGEDLPLDLNPKCAWALRNLHLFPVEVNRAPLEVLLRVPGIGARSAYKITEARKYTTLDFSALKKMRVVLKRARHFITANGKFCGAAEREIRGLLTAGERAENAVQLDLFSYAETERARSVRTGEL